MISQLRQQIQNEIEKEKNEAEILAAIDKLSCAVCNKKFKSEAKLE